MSYVNKVIDKSQVEHEIWDARVPEASVEDAGKVLKVGEDGGFELGEGGALLENTSIIVSSSAKEPEPEAVAEFDGVKYFHKQEFDAASFSVADNNKSFDLLTGEELEGNDTSRFEVRTEGPSYPSGSVVAKLRFRPGWYVDTLYIIEKGSSVVPSATFTSRALTVVDTPEEVTDETKICLPTCSAYYGFLSEDGNTFISYFNLKGEGLPSKVNSAKIDDKVIPFADGRIPDAIMTDAGKVIKVNSAGKYTLASVFDGTKLYKHEITAKDSSSAEIWSAIIYDYSEINYTTYDFNGSASNRRIGTNDYVSFRFSLPSNPGYIFPLIIGYQGPSGIYAYYYGLVGSEYTGVGFNFYDNLSTITDIVTPV